MLPGLVAGLVETGAIRAGQFVAHASGRYGYAVLDPATRAGALPLALHPVMTFTGTSIDLARLVGCPFGVTAPDAAASGRRGARRGDGRRARSGSSEGNRALYHAALAHGANHLVTLVAQTLELLAAAGVDAARAARRPAALAPRSTTRCATATRRSPARSRAATRGTVAAHVRELGDGVARGARRLRRAGPA